MGSAPVGSADGDDRLEARRRDGGQDRGRGPGGLPGGGRPGGRPSSARAPPGRRRWCVSSPGWRPGPTTAPVLVVDRRGLGAGQRRRLRPGDRPGRRQAPGAPGRGPATVSPTWSGRASPGWRSARCSGSSPARCSVSSTPTTPPSRPVCRCSRRRPRGRSAAAGRPQHRARRARARTPTPPTSGCGCACTRRPTGSSSPRCRGCATTSSARSTVSSTTSRSTRPRWPRCWATPYAAPATSSPARARTACSTSFATERQREVVDRVTGVMSLLEGHADVVMDGVGPEVIP